MKFLKNTVFACIAISFFGFKTLSAAEGQRVISAKSFIEYEKGAKDIPLTAAQQRNLSIDAAKADAVFKTTDALLIVKDFPVSQNEVKTLRLVSARPVADGQTKWVIGTKNGNTEIAAPEFTTFVGIVDNEPKSRVVLTYSGGELIGSIERGQSEKMMIIPAEAGAPGQNLHLIAGEYASGVELFKNGFDCGNERIEQMQPAEKNGKKKNIEQSRPLSNDLLEVEVAIECDTDLFNKLGKDVSRVQKYVVSVFNMVSRIYEDEVNVTYHLPYVRVWTENPVDPYTAEGDIWESLIQLTDYMNANPPDIPHHLVHMLTSPGTTGVGGIAWMGGLCSNDMNYSVSGVHGSYTYPFQGYTWDVMVIAHEIGHNFGSPHTHSCEWNPPLDSCVSQEIGVDDACEMDAIKPNPGTIMSYCHLINAGGVQLTFGPRPQQVIRAGAEFCLSTPVKPTLVLQNPLGKTRIVSGMIEEIRWSSARVSTIGIQYSSDSGKTWRNIAENIPAIQRKYAWKTPIENYKEVLVRIFDVNNAATGDTSIATFSIEKPYVTLKYPTGNEKIGIGETINITWVKDLIERVHVEFSGNGGQTWKRISSSHSGTFLSWKITEAATNQGVIRIISAENSTLFALSQPFSLNSAKATLISPNGGERWEKNSTEKIQWSSEFVKRVHVEYSLNNGQSWEKVRILPVLADSGYTIWRVPDTTSENVLVRLRNDADKSIITSSVSTFAIVNSATTSIAAESKVQGLLKIGNVYFDKSADNIVLHLMSSTSSAITIQLFSSDGSVHKVLTNNFSDKPESYLFNTEHLAQGSYFLVVRSGREEKTIPINIIR
jgi:hypothetical protein